MKLHKQSVLLETETGYLDVVSYYDSGTNTFGADIYYCNMFVETINSMTKEPSYENLVSLGYSFIKINNYKIND